MSLESFVVVVDDQDALRFAKVQTLRRAGFRVVEASTGGEALEQVAHERPDVLVLDVNLPDMSGLDVCRRIRESDTKLPALQILQVSNTAILPADRVRGLQGGADAYLTEPLDPSVLIATVNALLRVRRAEAALAAALEGEREARALAEAASRMKDEFIATLSHELRTPLNAMMGWLWQLRQGNLRNAARARALESLERNATLQAQLINDLLDLSRSAKGKLRLEMHVLDLRSAIDMAVDSTRGAAARKHIRIDVSGPPVPVIADSARLQQIFGNLLANAVQFTPTGGTITVEVRSERDEAIASITDSGSGIDPELLPHVFDPFRQGEAGLTRRHGGLGLGLAVVRQLVELHGGRVRATSGGVGHGATFAVVLPREDRITERADGQPVLSGLHVLVVDGDASETDMVALMLESSGAVVSTAASKADASQALESESVTLMVCAGLTDEDREGLMQEARKTSDAIHTVGIARPFAPADVVRAAARAIDSGGDNAAVTI